MLIVIGLTFSSSDNRYALDRSALPRHIRNDLSEMLTLEADQTGLMVSVSTLMYDYVYNEKTYPEDIDRKRELIHNDESALVILRELMTSFLTSIIKDRRDLLMISNGVNLAEGKVIQGFNDMLRDYRFAVSTMDIFNKHPVFKYKQRLSYNRF